MGTSRASGKGQFAAWLLLILVLSALVAATPLILRDAAPHGMHWTELADISQTYTAISIPFSGLALLGVIASLAYQARQVHNDREDAQLAAHRELTMRLLEYPELLVCWGPPPRPVSAERAKQHAYINLIISFWHADFIVGRLNGRVVTGAAQHLFRGEIGREFWQLQHGNWRETAASRGRRSQRFVGLVDEGFARALAAGPPIPAPLYFLPEGP